MFDVILYNSSILGDMDGVRHALGNGGRVGLRAPLGLTPLIVAAQNGHRDICGLLLAHGGNVNDGDQKGCKPLGTCIRKRTCRCVCPSSLLRQFSE